MDEQEPQKPANFGISDLAESVSAASADRAGFGQGRPKAESNRRQTSPSDEFQADGTARKKVAPWRSRPVRVRRREPAKYSLQNTRSRGQTGDTLRNLASTTGLVGRALRLRKHLLNSGVVISVKGKDEVGDYTVEDTEAKRIVESGLKKAGTFFLSDIDGLSLGLEYLIDGMADQIEFEGATCVEVVLTRNRRDIADITLPDPATININRTSIPGIYTISQSAVVSGKMGSFDGVEGIPLNPNLVTYRPWSGAAQTPYGLNDNEGITQVGPLWSMFFANLATFMNRSALGFLDGSVSTEHLMKMWNYVPAAMKKKFNNDFMTWATAVTKYFAEEYSRAGQASPDGLLAHLDLMEVASKSSGKESLPIAEGSKEIRRELYAAVDTPGELLGEEARPSDRYTQVRIEAYHALLSKMQRHIAAVLNRVANILLRVAGYDKDVQAMISFNEIKMDDDLTRSQADQLRVIVSRMLRDEGVISQRDFAHRTVKKDPVGKAPRMDGDDIDGPSYPAEKYLGGAQPGGDAAAAGGPAFGGAKKGRESDPTQTQDKKN